MLTCHILSPNDPTTSPPFFSSENKERGRKGRKNGGRADEDWFRSFPSEQFQALLTLFSKFFASFPRGTCTLSGFGRCLALDGSYRPRLGLHSQAVRLYKEQTLPRFEFFAIYCPKSRPSLSLFIIGHEQDYHLLWCPFPGRTLAGDRSDRVIELCLTTPQLQGDSLEGDSPRILGLG